MRTADKACSGSICQIDVLDCLLFDSIKIDPQRCVQFIIHERYVMPAAVYQTLADSSTICPALLLCPVDETNFPGRVLRVQRQLEMSVAFQKRPRICPAVLRLVIL